jgi:hypothetical protein
MTKMAGVFSRFSLATESAIQRLKNNSKMKILQVCVSVWKKWCVEKKITSQIEIFRQRSEIFCFSAFMPKGKINTAKITSQTA